MNDRRNMAALACQYDRNRDETSFREYNIRIQEFDQFLRFAKPLDDPERIGKILQAEITAQLSGRDAMIGNAELFDQFLLDSVVGTDIVDIIL